MSVWQSKITTPSVTTHWKNAQQINVANQSFWFFWYSEGKWKRLLLCQTDPLAETALIIIAQCTSRLLT